MSWKKNDWNKIIDFIFQKTLNELKLNNKERIFLISEKHLGFHTNGIFAELLLSKNSNITIYNISLNNLDSINNIENELICSTITTEFFKFLRILNKEHYYRIDFFPFINLFQSDLLEIAKEINYSKYDQFFEKIENFSLCQNKFDFTIKDLEWADKEELSFKIITSEQDPSKNKRWLGYSGPQQKIIAKLWQVEKDTRYKVKLPTLLSLEGIINRI